MALFLRNISIKMCRYSCRRPDDVRSFCSFSNKVATQTQTTSASSDILMNSIRNERAIQSILNLVQNHEKSLDSKHVVQALRMLFSLQKSGDTDLSPNQIVKNVGFEKLCRLLKRNAGALELNDALESIKVLSFLGVRADSVVMQTLLQIIRHGINSMSLQQIIFLEFLIRQFTSTPLTDALLIALPIIFEIQLPIQADRANPQALVDYLQYASHSDVSSRCLEFLSNCLLAQPAYPGRIATSIVWSICDMESNACFEPLLMKAVDSLVLNAYEIPFGDLETCLTKLTRKYTLRLSFYYHEVFFDVVANIVVEKDLGLHYAVYVMRKFVKVGHLNTSLQDYISVKLLEDPSQCHDPFLITDVPLALAISNIRPAHWENLENILQNARLPHETSDLSWLRVAASMSALGIYRADVIQKALNEDSLKRSFRHGYMLDYDYYLTLAQAVSTFRPEFERFTPSSAFRDDIAKKVKFSSYEPLINSMKYAFGERFVVNNVTSRLGHRIDYVLATNRDGNFVQMTQNNLQDNEPIFLEDFKVSAEDKIILVLTMLPHHYTINCQRMRAVTVLMLRTLASRGYAVLPINLDSWKSLPDMEKIPFLKRCVFESSVGTFLCDTS